MEGERGDGDESEGYERGYEGEHEAAGNEEEHEAGEGEHGAVFISNSVDGVNDHLMKWKYDTITELCQNHHGKNFGKGMFLLLSQYANFVGNFCVLYNIYIDFHIAC